MKPGSFTPFPKLARISRDCIITEKIDGTNAQVAIFSSADEEHVDGELLAVKDGSLFMFAGSRTRFLDTSSKGDNFGFAKWVKENADELFKLGKGIHFGEWWGQGIQRGYGIAEKRFSLFHTRGIAALPSCVSVVPVLATHTFSTDVVDACIERLRTFGSEAAPGFMNPEGVVVYHTAAGIAFKKTIDADEKPKGLRDAA